MTIGQVTVLMRDAVFEIAILAAPILLTALLIGLIVSVLQATTSIQEQTLTFVPKITAILLVLLFLGGWMFTHLAEYTKHLFSIIPTLVK